MGCILWPFRFVWQLVTTILGLTGRLVAVLVGMGLVVIGVVLTVTVVGAVIGIPLILLGLVLVARGIF